jgi:hypothetical protein
MASRMRSCTAMYCSIAPCAAAHFGLLSVDAVVAAFSMRDRMSWRCFTRSLE